MLRDLAKECEDDAIAYFGADKIGTKKKRINLHPIDQQYLINWLLTRYSEKLQEIYSK